MKYFSLKSLALIIVCFISIIACQASENPAIPVPTVSKETNAVNEFEMGKCHFKINNFDGGSFDLQKNNETVGSYRVPGRGNLVNWSLVLNCISSTDQDSIDTFIDAKNVDGKWIWIDSGEPFDKAQHFMLLPLEGINWKGTGATFDLITGEPSKRQRQFGFCLIYESQALCGNTPISSVSHPMDKTLEQIKSILKNIEFLPTR